MDPSSFYRLNEALAREVARLDAQGALDPLKELLAAGGQTLRVSSLRAEEGLEELLGELRPGSPGTAPLAVFDLTPATSAKLAGCGGCATPSGEKVEAVARELRAPPGGFDYEGFMAVRSQFLITPRQGEPREVYMPDHVCPECLNLDGNAIKECSRVCGRCGFEW